VTQYKGVVAKARTPSKSIGLQSVFKKEDRFILSAHTIIMPVAATTPAASAIPTESTILIEPNTSFTQIFQTIVLINPFTNAEAEE
jgi:hypothetical protein